MVCLDLWGSHAPDVSPLGYRVSQCGRGFRPTTQTRLPWPRVCCGDTVWLGKDPCWVPAPPQCLWEGEAPDLWDKEASWAGSAVVANPFCRHTPIGNGLLGSPPPTHSFPSPSLALWLLAHQELKAVCSWTSFLVTNSAGLLPKCVQI